MVSTPHALAPRGAAHLDATPTLPIATGELDLERALLTRDDGSVVRLSGREARLLAYLADRLGEDVSRDDLLRDVWGHHALSMSRAVDTAIARLRKKIEPDPALPTVLCTAHGEGYRLVACVPSVRSVPVARVAAPVLDLDGVRVDLGSGLVDGLGERATLTAAERRLLEVLSQRPGVLVDAGRLARQAGISGGRPALCNAVHRLRRKIEVDPEAPRWLVGVRGQGYRLDAAPEAPAGRLDVLRETMWALAAHAATVLGLDDLVIYARDGAYLIQAAAHGEKAPAPGEIADPIVLRIGEGIVGDAAATGRPQRVADVQHDARYVRDLAAARSELAVPIVLDSEVIGVMDSESRAVAAYGEAHQAMFASLAALTAAMSKDLGRALAA